MKNIKFTSVILSIIIFSSFSPCEVRAEYLKGQCVSGDGYFDVKFSVTPGPNSPYPVHHQGISIQKSALSMKYPPSFYAVFWEDIVSITFTKLEDSPNEGILTIKFKGILWGENADELGLIDRSCWDDLSKFIHLNGIGVVVDGSK